MSIDDKVNHIITIAKSIYDATEWINENPAQIAGVVERTALIKYWKGEIAKHVK